jgi:SRSO17 transposase
LKSQRLNIILKILQGREINLIIDETGDKRREIRQIMGSDSILVI